jgi:DNA-binding protein
MYQVISLMFRVVRSGTDLITHLSSFLLHAPKASGSRLVELKAMGKAINKAVTIAEILKRKMPLHQVTTLSSCEIINVYEPLEEGLDTVVNHHYVSCLTITLSTDSSAINIHDIGYQVRQIRHVNS